MISYFVTYIIACIAFAEINKQWIFKGKRIYHGLNGLLHISFAVVALFFLSWQVAIASLMIGRVTFDTALNLFRGLPIGYVPFKPKSIVDRVEKSVFGYNGIAPKIIYIVAAIIILIV